MASRRHAEKNAIARQVVEEIRTVRKGRFLVKVPLSTTDDGEDTGQIDKMYLWQEVSEELMLEKTKQALRDKQSYSSPDCRSGANDERKRPATDDCHSGANGERRMRSREASVPDQDLQLIAHSIFGGTDTGLWANQQRSLSSSQTAPQCAPADPLRRLLLEHSQAVPHRTVQSQPGPEEFSLLNQIRRVQEQLDSIGRGSSRQPGRPDPSTRTGINEEMAAALQRIYSHTNAAIGGSLAGRMEYGQPPVPNGTDRSFGISAWANSGSYGGRSPRIDQQMISVDMARQQLLRQIREAHQSLAPQQQRWQQFPPLARTFPDYPHHPPAARLLGAAAPAPSFFHSASGPPALGAIPSSAVFIDDMIQRRLLQEQLLSSSLNNQLQQQLQQQRGGGQILEDYDTVRSHRTSDSSTGGSTAGGPPI
jgi:hypothetical protein